MKMVAQFRRFAEHLVIHTVVEPGFVVIAAGNYLVVVLTNIDDIADGTALAVSHIVVCL